MALIAFEVEYILIRRYGIRRQENNLHRTMITFNKITLGLHE